MSKAFLILGTPRSGTSVLAGILQKLGIFMGDNHLPASDMNPTGFFQDIDFEELFDFLNIDYIPVYPYTLPQDRLVKLEKVVKSRCALGVDWGTKFSKTALVLKDIQKHCTDDIHLLITKRNTEHSIASWEKWSEPHDAEAEVVINRAKAAIEAAIEGCNLPMQIVDFDLLIDNPKQEIERLAKFIGKEVTEEAVQFVDASLKHYG